MALSDLASKLKEILARDSGGEGDYPDKGDVLMKITRSTVEKIVIANAVMSDGCGTLDPIAVMIEDCGDGAGKITITCWGEAWTHYWSHMGCGVKFMDFFSKASDDYLVGKLKTGIEHEVKDLDPERMEAVLKAEIVRLRREDRLTHEAARDFWNQAEWVDESNYDNTFSEVFQDEWWYDLPRKPNPDYQYLLNIVKAVKAAFLQLKESDQ